MILLNRFVYSSKLVILYFLIIDLKVKSLLLLRQIWLVIGYIDESRLLIVVRHGTAADAFIAHLGQVLGHE